MRLAAAIVLFIIAAGFAYSAIALRTVRAPRPPSPAEAETEGGFRLAWYHRLYLVIVAVLMALAGIKVLMDAP